MTVAVPTDRDVWLTERRKGIGSSDVAGILGLSPWATPWSVFADKVGLTPLDVGGESEAMEFGRRAEAMIAPWFHDLTGMWLLGEQSTIRSRAYPHHIATADGFASDRPDCIDRNAMLAVAEIKTTSDTPAQWEECIPLHYEVQATWLAHVAQLPNVWFIVLHLAFGKPQLRTYLFTPDEQDAALVVDEVERFWHDHVLTGVPPATDGRRPTSEAIKHAYPDGDGQLEADDRLAAVVHELDQTKRSVKSMEGRIESMENELKVTLADHASDLTYGLTVKGEPNVIASWRTQADTRIDSKAVRAEFGTRFDTHSTRRVLRLHLPKPEQPSPKEKP